MPAAAQSAVPQRRRGAAGTGARPEDRKPTQRQVAGIRSRLERLGLDDVQADAFVTKAIGHTPAATFDEASRLLDALEAEIAKKAKQ